MQTSLLGGLAGIQNGSSESLELDLEDDVVPSPVNSG